MLKSKIENIYERHDCNRVCQGDILRDYVILFVNEDNKVDELKFPYLVVLTQDCDLNQSYEKNENNEIKIKPNQFIPNILVLPAFPAAIAREGNHLSDLFNIFQERINSSKWKSVEKYHDYRYHFLSSYSEYQVPDLLIDFKTYFTISYQKLIKIHKEYYLATINELFREYLSQRFCNYLSRIGLPEINK